MSIWRNKWFLRHHSFRGSVATARTRARPSLLWKPDFIGFPRRPPTADIKLSAAKRRIKVRLNGKYITGAAALVTAIGAMTLPTSVASAATMAPVHGTVQVWVNPSDGGGGTVNLTGALGDAGIAEPANSLGHIVHGSQGNNANYRLLELTKGWILVNITQFNKVTNNPNASPTVFNQSNCSVVFSGKAPVQFVHGTGAYVGITGTIELTFVFAGTVPKTAKGTCNENANPIGPGGGYNAINGSGTVTVP